MNTTGASASMLDPWELPGRTHPLHHTHDPFYGRSSRAAAASSRIPSDTVSSPPSEGQPAVAAFRSANFPVSPTTFYTYDGRIASTLHATPAGQNSNPLDSGLRQSASAGNFPTSNGHLRASTSNLRAASNTPRTPGKQFRKRTEPAEFEWHSTPLRHNGRDMGERASSQPTFSDALRRGSLNNFSSHDSTWDWTESPIQPDPVSKKRDKKGKKGKKPRRRSSLDGSISPRESVSWDGVESDWRPTALGDAYALGVVSRRSGSYDELETRHRQRFAEDRTAAVDDADGDDDGLAVFTYNPNRGPMITLDHHPSST